MNTLRGAAALLLAMLVASPSVAQQTFYCESTEGRAQARIVGGQNANIDNWPWQVALISPWGRSFCGGSVIAPRWVLTAAHCVEQVDADNFLVLVGTTDVSEGGQRFSVSAIRIHEAYRTETITDGKNRKIINIINDIALIRLTENIPGHRSIQLSSEKLDRVFARPGLCATVTGWGWTAWGGSSSESLLRADMPITATSACSGAYPNQLMSGVICAGYEQGKVDACKGDSGGPLVVRHGNSRRYVQVGVVSWGKNCALRGFPGIYTRVSKYIDWIQSHTGR